MPELGGVLGNRVDRDSAIALGHQDLAALFDPQALADGARNHHRALAGDLHRLVLVGEHPRQVECRRRIDAEVRKAMPGLVEHLGSVQQRLRGNAADIDASAAQRRPLLDHADDQFVIARTGDELALSFDASALAPLPAGFGTTPLDAVGGTLVENRLRIQYEIFF